MKLNQKKIRWILLEKKRGESSGVITKIQHITRRRVDQIWKRYRDTEVIPVIGRNMGRPKKPITDEESEIIERTHQRFKFGARMLEVIIRIRYELSISHNRIHRYLMDRGLARAEDSKRKQRKWVRYERDHSMSAGHIDWHEDGFNGLTLYAVLG